MICGSVPRAKRTPSIASSANRVAMPLSSVSPRYGSHMLSLGIGCSRLFARSMTGGRSPSFSTFSPVNA